MNDRFLFRGKRVDNLRKSWEIGHYVSVPRDMIVLSETMLNGNWNCFDVEPATIGQCTGLRDKNGALIFEGDIVRGYNAYISKIIYDKGAFWAWYPDDAKSALLVDVLSNYPIEVIGNIHDNPELLYTS